MADGPSSRAMEPPCRWTVAEGQLPRRRGRSAITIATRTDQGRGRARHGAVTALTTDLLRPTNELAPHVVDNRLDYGPAATHEPRLSATAAAPSSASRAYKSWLSTQFALFFSRRHERYGSLSFSPSLLLYTTHLMVANA